MAAFNLYDKDEIEEIAKIQESNNKIEDFFNVKREDWNKEIDVLLKSSNILYTTENAQIIVDVQATALAHRQRLNEEISIFLQKLSKERIKLKRTIEDRTLWYATGKTSLNLKGLLNNSQLSDIIDSHVAENKRTTELLEIHIEFLRTSSKILNDIGYKIKNVIELHNMLAKQ